MSDLAPEFVDANTPPDVIVTGVVPPRITDPTLGVELGPPGPAPAVPQPPGRRLVTIGDSLTHGVTSGAVFHTRLSWPAQLAAAIGITDFHVPSYGGPLDGLPINLESLVRQMEKKFGDDVSLLEKLRAPVVLHGIADANEDYWERGAGADPPVTHFHYDNLGIYGWDLRDALDYNAARAAMRAGAAKHDDLLGVKPAHDNDIAAHSVLAPFGIGATQVGAAAWHGANGGIDTLIVALGSNNALDAVVSKAVRWSGIGYDDLDTKDAFNVWTPTHFAQEFGRLVGELSAIEARRVVLATVPHVTIAPIGKGVNPDHPGEKWRTGTRYFPYYTDPWIDEKDFRATKHRHITHQQARAIDSAIDQYNTTITDAVRHARGEGRDWYVLDLCGLLDSLAYRRFEDDPAAADRNNWVPYVLPGPIAGLDTRFFRSNENGRYQGGLFGLDGIHPTSSGYGIIAQEVVDVLAVAGVPASPIDFAVLLAADTLNSDPPALVDDVFGLIAPFATRFLSRVYADSGHRRSERSFACSRAGIGVRMGTVRLMVAIQASSGQTSPAVNRPGLGVGLSAAVAVGVGVGALTAYGQGWLSDATTSLANSAGPWSVAAFLVARYNRRVAPAVFAAMLTLACCEFGYALATELRGGTNATSTVAFWLTAAVLAGPPLGVAGAWSTETGLRRGVGLAALGGVLLGEGFYGWSTVADTTDWRYWVVELVIGALVISFAAVRSQWPLHAAVTVATGVLTAAVVFAFGRLA